MDIWNKIRRGFTQPIVIVSGLPRSGTSMAMKMLEAGGIDLFVDSVRPADEDNPRGYFEHERVKQLQKEKNRSWLREGRGKAVKVISFLLTDLPPEHRYQVIFMNRHLDEVVTSQNKMLLRRGEELKQDDGEMKRLFSDHLQRVRSWLSRQRHFQVLEVHYSQVVASPLQQAERIGRFLDLPLQFSRMAEVVDPELYRNRS